MDSMYENVDAQTTREMVQRQYEALADSAGVKRETINTPDITDYSINVEPVEEKMTPEKRAQYEKLCRLKAEQARLLDRKAEIERELIVVTARERHLDHDLSLNDPLFQL